MGQRPATVAIRRTRPPLIALGWWTGAAAVSGGSIAQVAATQIESTVALHLALALAAILMGLWAARARGRLPFAAWVAAMAWVVAAAVSVWPPELMVATTVPVSVAGVATLILSSRRSLR